MSTKPTFDPVIVSHTRRVAIHPIDHPGFLHSLFWFSNELVMSTWGNFREILEYGTGGPPARCEVPATDYTRRFGLVRVTVHDGDRYTIVNIPMTSAAAYAEGFFQLLATITSVTGGTWYVLANDMLRILDAASTWVLPEPTAIPDIDFGQVKSRFLTKEAHRGDYLVGTINETFYVPTLAAIAPLVAHLECVDDGESLSTSDMFKRYVTDSINTVKSSGPFCPVLLRIENAHGGEGIYILNRELYYESDQALVRLPHPKHGYNLVNIINDRIIAHCK